MKEQHRKIKKKILANSNGVQINIKTNKTANSQNTWRQSRSMMPAPGSMSSKQTGHVNGSVFRTSGWS